MEKKKIETEEGSENSLSIRDVLFVLRRNLILILAIVVIVTSCGIAYSFIRKPNYTATHVVMFDASDEQGSSTRNDVNAMISYLETVLDFCDEGVVLDRASYYYTKYQNGNYKSASDFIATIDKEADNYVVTSGGDEHFEKSKIKVSSLSDSSSTNFVFTVSYTADDVQTAKDKVIILIYAYGKEANLKKDDKGVYFRDISVNIGDRGYRDCNIDLSKKQITLVAGLIGVVLALMVVYVKSALDKTVKTKQDLEHITGTDILATIERIGGENNG